MMKVRRVGMIALLTVATAVAPALAGNVTVGRFYTQLAQAKHLGFADAASAETSIRGAGFDLPKLPLDKSLTEGDLTSISSALGVTVTTEKPSQLINESQLNTFMSSFKSQLGGSAVRGSTFGTNDLPPASGNGHSKGKKKGHHKSGSEPI